jgi:SAM-dependent methyltransferase
MFDSIEHESHDPPGEQRAPDFASITARQQETWAEGDFHQIARLNVVMAEALCEAAQLRAGERVLDVACGSGTAALVAARRYCDVTGIDYVESLIERARLRANAEAMAAEFVVGDAQRLPFPDASFDAVLSVYGVQFAPDQERAARELLRVCRPAGRIALASPPPFGWSGDFFAVNAKHLPPPAGIASPLRWGTPDGLRSLLGAGTASLDVEERPAYQHFLSIDHAVDVFLTHFGPAIKASAASPDGRYRDDLEAVFRRYDGATEGSAIIENTYLLSIAERAPERATRQYSGGA